MKDEFNRPYIAATRYFAMATEGDIPGSSKQCIGSRMNRQDERNKK